MILRNALTKSLRNHFIKHSTLNLSILIIPSVTFSYLPLFRFLPFISLFLLVLSYLLLLLLLLILPPLLLLFLILSTSLFSRNHLAHIMYDDHYVLIVLSFPHFLPFLFLIFSPFFPLQSAVHYCALLCSALLYCALFCCFLLCTAQLCCTLLCSTRLAPSAPSVVQRSCLSDGYCLNV